MESPRVQFLQMNVAKYETYDVLDTNQHVALLSREANFLKLKEFLLLKVWPFIIEELKSDN